MGNTSAKKPTAFEVWEWRGVVMVQVEGLADFPFEPATALELADKLKRAATKATWQPWREGRLCAVCGVEVVEVRGMTCPACVRRR